MLSLEDLFTVGIGQDVAGAYLLSRGLLASPGDLRVTETIGGMENFSD